MAKEGKNARIDRERLVLLGLGGNAHGRHGAPWRAMARAVLALHAAQGAEVAGVSSLWRSAAVGVVRQAAFHNAVIALRWRDDVAVLLRLLKALERDAGRIGGRAWAARALDIDILAMEDEVIRPPGMGRRAQGRAAHRWQRRGVVLPHPAMHERAFVLLPLLEVAPRWRHPLLGADVRALAARLSGRERAQCRRLERGRAAQAWREMVMKVRSRGRVAD